MKHRVWLIYIAIVALLIVAGLVQVRAGIHC